MGSGRKKIEMKKIEKRENRMTSFSKRRKGLFKKVDEFRAKNGGKIGVMVISGAGKPYPHGDIEELSVALNSSSGYIPSYNEAFMGNGEDLKRWLNEIQVKNCRNLDELLRLKKQLLNIKNRIIRAEVESWTLQS